jgi:hypothetical protein
LCIYVAIFSALLIAKNSALFIADYNLCVQQPKPSKKTVTDTTKYYYWYGKKITKKQYQDSVVVIYLRICDSLEKTKTVN